MPNLFSYGTLQLKNVQRTLFGRVLQRKKDYLRKYVVANVTITDEKVIATSGKSIHPILQYTGNDDDVVEGTIFEVTEKEILHADTYEVADYKRTALQFESGTTAFVYLKNDALSNQ